MTILSYDHLNLCEHAAAIVPHINNNSATLAGSEYLKASVGAVSRPAGFRHANMESCH
jgi:hypothetical protein